MKVWSLFGLQSVRTWEDLRRFCTQAITNFSQILSNGVGFTDNINCQIVEVTLTTADLKIPHNFGKIPIGYVVLSAQTLISAYPVLGTAPWTATDIYLRAAGTGNFKIAIIGS